MTSYPILAALILWGSNPVTGYFRRLVDPTFRGLYQANAFDLAIMLPYFFVMAILAMYGLHRYALVYHCISRTAETFPARRHPWPKSPNGPKSPSSCRSTTSAT